MSRRHLEALEDAGFFPCEGGRAWLLAQSDPLRRFAVALASAVHLAEARAGIQRILRGEAPTEGAAPWTPEDVLRLWALCKLGRPAEVVANGLPVVIAASDTWGGRMLMPDEGMRASLLDAWRKVAAWCGLPLSGPHETKIRAGD